MVSERRRAQLGLLAGCVILVSTLTILYEGSRAAGTGHLENNGRGQIVGDSARATPPGEQGVRLAALGK
jgi:hypothetical protein